MLELLILVAFGWLFFKAVGLAFRVTWGLGKIIAVVLFALALPALFICLLVAGGIAILVPVALVAAAVGILKACV